MFGDIFGNNQQEQWRHNQGMGLGNPFESYQLQHMRALQAQAELNSYNAMKSQNVQKIAELPKPSISDNELLLLEEDI